MRVRATLTVGRTMELAELRRSLVATASSGTAVFVLGEAGVGKSRLAAEAASIAYETEMTVLRGRTGTVGPPVPYRPITEALLSLARNVVVPESPALAPYHAVLGRLVPEWYVAGTDQSPVSPVIMAEAVLRLVTEAGSRHGSLLVIEDLHDADPETLAVVEYLADNLDHQTLSMLVTARAEVGPAMDLITAVADRSGSTVLELRNLPRAQSDELIGQCLDAPVAELPVELTTQLWEDGAGNPFVVEELLRHMVAAGRLEPGATGWCLYPPTTVDVPVSLVRRIAQRTHRLGTQGVEVLTAAAVLGVRFPVSVLGVVTGLDDQVLLAHLRAALTAQLVEPDDTERDWYVFQSRLTAEAVLAILPPAQRVALSLAAADAVARLHPGLPAGWCQLAARLRAGAGDIGGAAFLHLEAGRRALQSGAATSAVRLLESARSLLDTGRAVDYSTVERDATQAEILTLLLYALAESGQFERAFALKELDDVGLGTHRRAAVTLRLAWVAQVAGQWSAARTQLRAARAMLAADPAPALAAELLAVEAYVTLEEPGVGAFSRAESMAREALELAAGHDRPDVESQAWHLLGQVARERDMRESERCFREARRIAEQARLPIWRIYALLGMAGNTWLVDGDASGVQLARAQAVAAGALPLASGMDGIEALHHALCGNFGAAEDIVAGGLMSMQRLKMNSVTRYLLMVRATIAAHRADRAAMETVLAEFSAAGGDPSPVGPLTVGLARVFCALLEENRPLALREAAVVRAAQRQHLVTLFLAGHHGLGLLLQELEEPGSAALGEPLSVLVPAAEMRWNRQFALLAAAVRLGRAGAARQARAAVERAGEIGRCYPVAWHLGLRLVSESAVRDGWTDAEDWLRAVEAFFHDAGIPVVASACRGLLRESGASVRQRRDGTERVPPALRARGVTVREYDVLVEMGKHLPNKGVAARLHISPRTVEKHIASLMLKTESTDRAGLLDHLKAAIDRSALAAAEHTSP